MRHEWKTPGGTFFSIDSERLEDRGPLGDEILRLAHELKVERAHREAAERQRDDKAEEIRCLWVERERLVQRVWELKAANAPHFLDRPSEEDLEEIAKRLRRSEMGE